MSQLNTDDPRDNRPDDDLDAQLREQASLFRHPSTPDIAGKVRRRLAQPATQRTTRRLIAWAILLILLALCGLMAVPEVRASILNWLRIGNIRILLPEPTTTVTPFRTPLNGTPVSSDLRQLVGRTTLAQARQKVPFAIPLPSYPAELGEPDYVYVQELGGPFVILIWVDHEQPERILLNYQILGEGVYVDKIKPVVVQQTHVNGKEAVWAVGPYLLQILRGGRQDTDAMQLVAGNTLIWADGKLTYRLESQYTLDEAIKIAESLR